MVNASNQNFLLRFISISPIHRSFARLGYSAITYFWIPCWPFIKLLVSLIAATRATLSLMIPCRFHEVALRPRLLFIVCRCGELLLGGLPGFLRTSLHRQSRFILR